MDAICSYIYNETYRNTPVILRTDSLSLVEAMQASVINERTHHKYFVELQTLKKVAEQYPQGVQFEHVYAHNGDEGNEEADALATKATSINHSPSPRRSRSKPPSERMKRRTRSVYVKRSAPPKMATKASRRIPLRRPVSKKSVHDVPTVSYIPPPDVIARRDMKQYEIGANDTPSVSIRKVENSQSEKSAVDKMKSELSLDLTQADATERSADDSKYSHYD